jgi:hypothetical protein
VDNCGLGLNTMPSAQAPAPGRAEQAARVVPGDIRPRSCPNHGDGLMIFEKTNDLDS